MTIPIYYNKLTVFCPPDFREILITEIAEANYNTFMETEDGFESYIEEALVNHHQLQQIKEKYAHVKPLIFSYQKVQKENWNVLWEKNVDPVVISEQCLIRASFHCITKKYPYEIIITPKMSFGTGHHPTTWLMLHAQLQIEHDQLTVMDAGCGTAILSIMASLRGAKQVNAFDIDDWSMENGRENVELNYCKNIRIQKGAIRDLNWGYPFQLILANINKNILIDEMPLYAQHLTQNGKLLLSGFYVADIPDLIEVANQFAFQVISQYERENWACLLFLLGSSKKYNK